MNMELARRLAGKLPASLDSVDVQGVGRGGEGWGGRRRKEEEGRRQGRKDARRQGGRRQGGKDARRQGGRRVP